MIRFSAVAGTSSQWAALLDKVDRDRMALSQRDLNRLLDAIVIAQDAEREARAPFSRRRLPRGRRR